MSISEKKETIIGFIKLFIALLVISVVSFCLWGLAVAACVFLIGLLYLLLLGNISCFISYDFTKESLTIKNLFGKAKVYTWDKLLVEYTSEEEAAVLYKGTKEALLVLDSDDLEEFNEFVESCPVEIIKYGT